MANVLKVAAWIVVTATVASADLQPRLGGAAVYDTDLNVTWLANANLAASNSFGTAGIDSAGRMSWSTAQNWIASLNQARYLGFSNWRLPGTPASDASCNGTFGCSGSEMGHLFYLELGGQAFMSIAAAHNSNYTLFSNFQDYAYWSSTNPADGSSAWTFLFANGSQAAGGKTNFVSVLPVLTGDVGASSVLPQFAFGGGWYSALYFTNTTANPASFTVNFISDSGTPLNVPFLGGSSTVVNLTARGTAIVEAPNAGSLNQGFVSVSLPGGVEAYGVFRQSVAGIADQEAVVPLSSAFSTSTTLIWDDTNYTTAVAIVNPSSVAVTVVINVTDTGGGTIGTSSVPLAPNNGLPAVLRSLPGLAGMAGKRGAATFTVTSGAVAVLGLRFNGAAFTSVPGAQK